MKVSGSYRKKFLWGLVYDHVFDEGKENDEIVIWGSGYSFFRNIRRGWLDNY